MTEEINKPPSAIPKLLAEIAEEEVPSQERKKAKRIAIDPVFKDIISLYFTGQSVSDFSINPGLQVGQTQLEIDVAVRANETLTQPDISQRLANTPFSFFAYLNVLEFKSVNDTLDLADFYRTAARALLAAASYYESKSRTQGKGKRPGRTAKKQAEPARVVSCLICASYPQSVQDQLQTPFQPLNGQPKGFYYRPNSSELFLPAYLIVCSELPIEERYYPLLVFAAGNKLIEFIQLVIDLELEVFVKYVARLHAEKVAEAFNRRKRGGKLTSGEERLARTLIDILGEEQVIEILRNKRLAKTLNEKAGTDELAQQLGVKGLIAMLHKLEPSLTAEDVTRLLTETEQKSVTNALLDQPEKDEV